MNIVRNLQLPKNVGNLFTIFVAAYFREPQPLSTCHSLKGSLIFSGVEMNMKHNGGMMNLTSCS